MADWEIWAVIGVLALSTAITRSGFWLIGHKVSIPPHVQDMLRYAPDVAARFGITAADAQRLAEDEALVDEEADSEEDADVDEGGLAANG